MIVSYLLPTVITLGGLVAYCAWQTNNFHRNAGLFFVGYVLSMVVWALGIWISLQLPTGVVYTYGTLAFWIGQVTFTAAGAVFYLSFEFISRYRNSEFSSSRAGLMARYGFYLLAFIMLLPNTVMIDFSVQPEGYIESTMGLGAAYFTLFLFYCYGLSLWTLSKRVRSATNKILKNQLKIMLFGYSFFITGMLLVNWILPVYLQMPQLNNTGPLFYLFEASCFFYAVTRYRFFDLKLSFYQGLVYGVNLALYTLPLYAMAKLVISGGMKFESSVLIGVMLMMALVTFWSMTLEAVDNLLSVLFYRNKKNPSRLITDCLDYFQASADEGYIQLKSALGVRNLSFLALDSPDGKIPLNLKQHFATDKDEPLIKEELIFRGHRNDESSKKLGDSLEVIMAAAILPVKNRNKELIGFLVLEKKLDGSLFSVQEIKATKDLLSRANIYISRERDYARNLEKLTRKGRIDKGFLDGLMHEIRHPLMMARNVSEIIDWAKLKPEDQAFLKDSQSSLSDLSHKLDRVELGAQWQAGKIPLQPSWNSLEDLGDYLAQSLVGSDAFKYVLDSCLENQLFRFDLEALKQASMELLQNGLRFNNSKQTVLELKVSAEGENLKFIFSDNGVGMPKERWGALFGLLEVQDTARNVELGGVGAGLAIVAGVAEAHGGTVQVLESSKKGTAIELVIPLESR